MSLFFYSNGDSHSGEMYGSEGKYNHISNTIIQMEMSGKEVARYEYFKYVDGPYSFLGGNTSACAKGKTNHAYGYKWKFEEEN